MKKSKSDITMSTIIVLLASLLCFSPSDQSASPFAPLMNYSHTVTLKTDISQLWWSVDEANQEIMFEIHVKTTGWIGLGISLGGGMINADIAIVWVDTNGRLFVQDRFTNADGMLMFDSQSNDWTGLNGREQNGWTIAQIKRPLHPCDRMDVPIKSGTNIIIYAYDPNDPTTINSVANEIGYHEDRRGSVILSLRSYNNPPSKEKFSQSKFFDFAIKNYVVPAEDTTYYCKVFKAPTEFTTTRHVIAHQFLIDSNNRDLVHHLLLYECTATSGFNDSNLPAGICDEIQGTDMTCRTNIATGWAVGADDITEFPPEAGYPIGGNFSVQYYLIEVHYSNPRLNSNRIDNSGIRFFIGEQRRQYDIGYITLGTLPHPAAIAIPPGVDQFIIDSYCPADISANIPLSGLTVINAFPHTHLQGYSVWTKLIRNKTAREYLFNAESYDFNYQFLNKLPKPIQLFPGDEFHTRCIYSTKNKSEITLGGERTRDEMCLNMFTYYPRIEKLHICLSAIQISAWKSMLKNNSVNYQNLGDHLKRINWTSASMKEWQYFYSNATRFVSSGIETSANEHLVQGTPKYVDLRETDCTVKSNGNMLNNILARGHGLMIIFLVLHELLTINA